MFSAPSAAPDPEPHIYAGGLFPFLDGYSLYPGQCTPNAAGAKTYVPTPGQILTPSTNKLRLPSINIHVVNSGATANQTGATVTITTADAGCTNTFPTQVSTNTTAGGAAALPAPGFPYGTYRLCAQWTNPSTGAISHGHADVRTGTAPGAYGSGHVNDIVTNTNAAGNTTNAGALDAIRLRLNQSGVCH